MIETNKGALYLDGSLIGIPIDACFDLTPEPNQDSIDISSLREPCEATIECTSILDPKTLLLILTGMKVTNNWLKMHGGVMSRKRYFKKKRRTNK